MKWENRLAILFPAGNNSIVYLPDLTGLNLADFSAIASVLIDFRGIPFNPNDPYGPWELSTTGLSIGKGGALGSLPLVNRGVKSFQLFLPNAVNSFSFDSVVPGISYSIAGGKGNDQFFLSPRAMIFRTSAGRYHSRGAAGPTRFLSSIWAIRPSPRTA
ncbi:MAG TPA: hypothetical protein VIM11_18405 [Tepidisphaeraceae bacterium]